MTAKKACTKCGETKPLEEFHRRNKASDGRQGRCKPCMIASVAEWSRANPAAHAAKVRRHRQRNPEATQRNRHRWNEANRGKTQEMAAAWRDKNPDRVRESGWQKGYEVRAREYGLDILIGVGDQEVTLASVVAAYGDRCFYGTTDACTGGFEQLDHRTPVRVGGPHTLDNVRPACAPCNNRRWNDGVTFVWSDPDDAALAA